MFSAARRLLSHRTPIRKAGFALLILPIVLAPRSGTAQATPVDQDFATLQAGSIVEKEISAGGQKHVYKIDLAAGQYIGFSVFQRGADLSLSLLDGAGKPIGSPEVSKAENHERLISIIAEESGRFTLTITSSTQRREAGRYRLKTSEIRTPTENERAKAEAFLLFSEGRKLNESGKYDEALAKQQRALEVTQRSTDLGEATVADIHNAIGLIYDNKGDLKNARDSYLKALESFERSLGQENYYVAAVLNNLGALYRSSGDYDKSAESIERALAIDEKLFGPEDITVASLLNNLAMLYYTKGEYVRAEQPFLRALAIRQKRQGSENMEVATVMNNLALVLRVRGDYAKSIAYFDKALATAEKALGPDHPSIAVTLSNLAVISGEVGDFPKGQELFNRAIAINEKRLGPDHPNVATNLNNFALLYDEAGQSDKAEPLFVRALAIREKTLEAGHPIIGATLGSLGLHYLNRGDLDKAKPLFVRALGITEKRLGGEHMAVATILNNLGLLHLRKGEHAEAEQMFLRALPIFQRANGPDHPACARVLGNLASLYSARRDIPSTLEFQRKYLAVRERNLDLNLFTGSERQKLAYMETLARDVDAAISMHAGLAPSSPELKDMAVTLILSRKGRTLDAMAGSVAALRMRARSEDQDIIDRLADVRTRLASLTLRGAGNEKPDVYRQKVKDAEAQREKLEDDLSRRSAEFRVQAQPLTLDAVRKVIPEGGALVEFAVYTPVRPGAAPGDTSLDQSRYAAYVVLRDGSIEWADLGESRLIDESISAWRLALSDSRNKDVDRLGRTLYDKLIKPLRTHLGNARHMMISPDGALNLIPFEALVAEENGYLIEQVSVSYLTSGRDLLRMGVARESKGPPMVVADPAFGRSETNPADKALGPKEPQAGAKTRASVTSTRNLSDTYFAPLVGTAQEARSIRTIFPDATTLTGALATESSLKSASGPRLLHIATHGFFLKGDDPVNTGSRSRSAASRGTHGNPLLRSGLALAGANRRGGGGADDGILTALEASGLDLWGTKLVVLSACDTGVGEVRNGEGVYGLRRAFVLAGTESLIMSMWPVSDKVTRELMTGYYRNLKNGIGRGESLRQIQLEMLKRPERRHPFYWASFIQSGEWANLDGMR